MPAALSRRQFALSCAAVLGARKGLSFATREVHVGLDPNLEVGLIQPELHGQFAEHLGTCIYGGLWVGKNSRVPNIRGYRQAAIEYLRGLVPVLRWPGGCFADDYHWRDGIGPAEKRPRTVNSHWGNYVEDNSFGTHEFVELCRLIGAEPYITGNVGSGTPQELRDWMEYCNYPSGSSLSDERAHNGSAQPFGVKYWAVGNENWGCGGQMTPEEYAHDYRRFTTYLRGFGDTKPFLIACGPSGNDTHWSRGFFDSMRRLNQVNGFAMHYYSRGLDNATRFTAEHVREQLGSFAAIEKAVVQQRALMDGYDPQRKIGLLIDEWGVWDRISQEEEKRYGRLWQQITMRSAVAAALGLNLFQRQADKLVMGNLAQMVNVLHAVLLTDEEHCVRTPTYYVFEQMKPHRGKTEIHTENPDSASPEGLSISASRKENELVITCVNPQLDQALKVTCLLGAAKAAGARGRILHDPDFNACNTFARPDRVVPKDLPVEAGGSRVALELPPLSVATATVRLE